MFYYNILIIYHVAVLKLQTLTQDICMSLLAGRHFITWGRRSALI